jgi:hypothetical protein
MTNRHPGVRAPTQPIHLLRDPARDKVGMA